MNNTNIEYNNETNTESTMICDKLYKDGTITYNKYLECVGLTDIIRTADISDNHKYGLNGDTTAQNIFNERVYIYHEDNDVGNLYLSVLSNDILLLNGLLNPSDSQFEIRKTSPSTVNIYHITTDQYLGYSLNNNEFNLILTPNNTINNEFVLSSYIQNGINKFKIHLVKPSDKSESNNTIIIDNTGNNNNKLTISTDDNFVWYINEVQDTPHNNNDTLTNNITTIKNKYINSVKNYIDIKNKIDILENTKKHIKNTIDNIFDIYYTMQKNNKIAITNATITNNYNTTLNHLNNKEFADINNIIEQLETEQCNNIKDIDLYKNNINQLLNNIIVEIDNINEKTKTIKKHIQQYNTTLLNNNIIINVDDIINSDDINNNRLVRAEINKNVANHINNTKTKYNFVFMSVIVLCIIIIILQLLKKIS